MHILIRDFANDGVLAGAITGRKVLAQLVDLTSQEPSSPEPVFLDFNGVEVATASFLREAVLRFRDDVRRRRSNFYPVIANASQLIIDELEVLLTPSGDVMMTCALSDALQASEPRLIGTLDPKQKVTFDLVQQKGETDAAELKRQHSESDEVGQTAWNNRLASLAVLGLIVELSQGRAKRYRPLFSEG